MLQDHVTALATSQILLQVHVTPLAMSLILPQDPCNAQCNVSKGGDHVTVRNTSVATDIKILGPATPNATLVRGRPRNGQEYCRCLSVALIM